MTLEAIAAAINAHVPQINEGLSAFILQQNGDPLETSISERRQVSSDALGVNVSNTSLDYNLSYLTGMSSFIVDTITVKAQTAGSEGISYIRVDLKVSALKDFTTLVAGNFTADVGGIRSSVDFTGEARVTGAKQSYPAAFSVKITDGALKITGFQMGGSMSSGKAMKLGSATASLTDMGVFEIAREGFENMIAGHMNDVFGKRIVDGMMNMLQTVIRAEIEK